jgi:hypothetical protein
VRRESARKPRVGGGQSAAAAAARAAAATLQQAKAKWATLQHAAAQHGSVDPRRHHPSMNSDQTPAYYIERKKGREHNNKVISATTKASDSNCRPEMGGIPSASSSSSSSGHIGNHQNVRARPGAVYSETTLLVLTYGRNAHKTHETQKKGVRAHVVRGVTCRRCFSFCARARPTRTKKQCTSQTAGPACSERRV